MHLDEVAPRPRDVDKVRKEPKDSEGSGPGHVVIVMPPIQVSPPESSNDNLLPWHLAFFAMIFFIGVVWYSYGFQSNAREAAPISTMDLVAREESSRSARRLGSKRNGGNRRHRKGGKANSNVKKVRKPCCKSCGKLTSKCTCWGPVQWLGSLCCIAVPVVALILASGWWPECLGGYTIRDSIIVTRDDQQKLIDDADNFKLVDLGGNAREDQSRDWEQHDITEWSEKVSGDDETDEYRYTGLDESIKKFNGDDAFELWRDTADRDLLCEDAFKKVPGTNHYERSNVVRCDTVENWKTKQGYFQKNISADQSGEFDNNRKLPVWTTAEIDEILPQ